MPRLRDIAIKYSVDKLYTHSYIPVYEAILKDLEVKRMLEIGIGYEDLMKHYTPHYIHGASLRMWSEFWPKAQIFGCDIREDTLFQEGNIWTEHCDQSKEEDLNYLAYLIDEPLDLIIDDGSHQYEHQRTSAKVLLPHVRKGGLYVIEDVWPNTGEMLAKEFNGRLYLGSTQGDDNLVVIHT